MTDKKISPDAIAILRLLPAEALKQLERRLIEMRDSSNTRPADSAQFDTDPAAFAAKLR